MTKHTPGEWRIDWGLADYILIETEEKEIATIELDEHGARVTAEQEANAYLIAESPNLLEALLGLMELKRNCHYCTLETDCARHAKARAAIARATGEADDS